MENANRPTGVSGKILWVDLSSGELAVESPGDEVYRQYLGGYGLGVHYLYKHIELGCDPLGPGNVLGFCPGFFNASGAPMAGKCAICGKSPLTGGWNDSTVGGHIGPAIKRAGYDAIFATGTSEKPVYLLIDDNGPQLLDASELWGLDTEQTETALKERHGNKVRSCQIGKAGELLSPIAGIVTELRIAGRGGLGAVMGSKNLKAVCLAAGKKLAYADPKAISATFKEYSLQVNKNAGALGAKMATKFAPAMGSLVRAFKIEMSQNHQIGCRVFKNWGTAFATQVEVSIGDTPVKNFSGSYVDYPLATASKFTTDGMDRWITGHQGCDACPVQCGHVMSVPELGLDRVSRPEYETMAAFGALQLNENPLVVVEANDLLHRAGMDSISAGVTIAYTIECCEKGVLAKGDLACNAYPDGFLPSWTDPGSTITLLKMMIDREGIGDLLARGVKVASEKIGRGSSDWAIAANGMELAMHDPRKIRGLAISYLADPTPGRHTAACLDYQSGDLNHCIKGLKFDMSRKGRLSGSENAKFVKIGQVFNCVGLCQFFSFFASYPLVEMFKAVAGWEASLDEILTTGHRIQTLRQMFNAREGKIGFEIPKRVLGIPPLETGSLAGVQVDPKPNIELYFKSMGFDETGVPTQETLEKLDLAYLVPDLDFAKGCEVPSFS
jgi:aldehyde:ferredoxin oxidoreductase